MYINLNRINRTTMNSLLKVSRFFHDLQVNVLLTNIFLDFFFQKALLIILQTSGNTRIFLKYYYNRDFNRYKRYFE